jgi:hypothetical protein
MRVTIISSGFHVISQIEENDQEVQGFMNATVLSSFVLICDARGWNDGIDAGFVNCHRSC